MTHAEAVARLRRICGQREGFIVPVRSVNLHVEESLIDGDPEKDFAIITSDTAYGDIAVEMWIAEKSGLRGWHVIPGYPYLNADKEIEWKVRRMKDW